MERQAKPKYYIECPECFWSSKRVNTSNACPKCSHPNCHKIDHKPMTENMRNLLRRAVTGNYRSNDIWRTADAYHGPAGFNVIEGLCDRGMLELQPSNRGWTLQIAQKGRDYFHPIQEAGNGGN